MEIQGAARLHGNARGPHLSGVARLCRNSKDRANWLKNLTAHVASENRSAHLVFFLFLPNDLHANYDHHKTKNEAEGGFGKSARSPAAGN